MASTARIAGLHRPRELGKRYHTRFERAGRWKMVALTRGGAARALHMRFSCPLSCRVAVHCRNPPNGSGLTMKLCCRRSPSITTRHAGRLWWPTTVTAAWKSGVEPITEWQIRYETLGACGRGRARSCWRAETVVDTMPWATGNNSSGWAFGGGVPMGGAGLQNPARQLGGNVSFAQSLTGSQPATPLDLAYVLSRHILSTSPAVLSAVWLHLWM